MVIHFFLMKVHVLFIFIIIMLSAWSVFNNKNTNMHIFQFNSSENLWDNYYKHAYLGCGKYDCVFSNFPVILFRWNTTLLVVLSLLSLLFCELTISNSFFLAQNNIVQWQWMIVMWSTCTSCFEVGSWWNWLNQRENMGNDFGIDRPQKIEGIMGLGDYGTGLVRN